MSISIRLTPSAENSAASATIPEKLPDAFRVRYSQSTGYFFLALHRSESGSISIVSVFSVMFLAMLLGMVMNTGRQANGKIRMQNAADSAAYSGGVVLARGMNSLAFTNHLLCDVFAVTAFLREARDKNSASYAPQILAAWKKVAPAFQASGLAKFEALGSAIEQKVPLEQKMVDRYSDWAKSVSDNVLPLMEKILSEELIPKYQRAVVEAFPDIAQAAARETAARNGPADQHRGTMLGVLWRPNGEPVGVGSETGDRTLPVVDPELDSEPNQEEYLKTARAQRATISHKYLNDWNNDLLRGFDRLAKMSQFGSLWRGFTCGYLEKLLNEEYPHSNLPFVIRENPAATANANKALEKNYTFISVVYWKKAQEILPGLFRNPLDADSQAFAEVHLFVPRQRLEFIKIHHSSGAASQDPLGGVPGEEAFEASDSSGDSQGGGGDGSSGPTWTVGRVGGPTSWDLLNQNWNCQLAPAANPAVPTILQAVPNVPGFDSGSYKLPNLQGLTSEEIQQISPH